MLNSIHPFSGYNSRPLISPGALAASDRALAIWSASIAEDFRRAAESSLDPSASRSLLVSAGLHATEAKAHLMAILELGSSPYREEAFFRLGQLAEEERKYDDAKCLYYSALPKSSAAYIALITLLAHSGDQETANTVLQEFHYWFPGEVEAQSRLKALINRTVSNRDLAIDAFIYKNRNRLRELAMQGDCLASFYLGEMERERGNLNPSEVKEVYLNSMDPSGCPWRERALERLEALAQQQGDVEAAQLYRSYGIRYEERDIIRHVTISLATGKVDQITHELINGGFRGSRTKKFWLGWIHIERGEFDKAREQLKERLPNEYQLLAGRLLQFLRCEGREPRETIANCYNQLILSLPECRLRSYACFRLSHLMGDQSPQEYQAEASRFERTYLNL